MQQKNKKSSFHRPVVFISLLLIYTSSFEIIYMDISQEDRAKVQNSQADDKAAEKLLHSVIFITYDLALDIIYNSGNREMSDIASVLQ